MNHLANSVARIAVAIVLIVGLVQALHTAGRLWQIHRNSFMGGILRNWLTEAGLAPFKAENFT